MKLVELRGTVASIAVSLRLKFQSQNVTKEIARKCPTLFRIFLTKCGCHFLVSIMKAGDSRGPDGAKVGLDKFFEVW